MKKTMAILFVILISVLFLIIWFYNSIESNHWREETRAKEAVLRETDLVKIDRVETFHGEKAMSIVFGENQEGNSMIVWVTKDEVHPEYTADGVTGQAMKEKVLQEKPNSEILRIVPGTYNGQYAWEVFYKVREKDGKRHYYDYYRFQDGEWLDTYRLSKE